MSLKVPKSKKTKTRGSIQTLGAHHDENMELLSRQSATLPQMRQAFEKKRAAFLALSNSMDLVSIHKKRKMVEELEDLEKLIANVSTNQHMCRYLQKTHRVLFDYYTESESGEDDTRHASRTDLLRRYKHVMGVESCQSRRGRNECEGCGEPLSSFSHGTFGVCNSCGAGQRVEADNEKADYREVLVESNYYAYKRINHLRECLNQWQGKENTFIPDEVYDSIIVELKKERIKNLATLTPKIMRALLRKLKLNKFYEHIPQILMKLTNRPPLKISKDIEEKLCEMFLQLQQPFAECAPEGRKNFMSYSFTINKLTNLLGLYEIQEYFPLLKSREKLREQDRIWKAICSKLDWPFYPSM